jgi:hypothetical protein
MKSKPPTKRIKKTGVTNMLQLTDSEEETGKYINVYDLCL